MRKTACFLFFFGLLLNPSLNAQKNAFPHEHQNPVLLNFMKNYIHALKVGDSQVIARSIQSSRANSQGWDEGVAAAMGKDIASKSKKQLKGLRLNKSSKNWSFKTLKSSNKNRSIVAILVPTNKTNPKLVTTKGVMTHPYFFKGSNSTRGVVFEVEVTIVEKDILNPKIIIEGHSDPLRRGN